MAAASLIIESAGLVYDAREHGPQRGIAFLPSLCPLADGSILAGLQAGPAKNAATGTIRLARSADGGRTFSAPLLVAEHPDHAVSCWDQRLCTGSEVGSFTGLFWSHDLVGKRDLTVHMRRARLHGGTTAGPPPAPLPIPGQIAAPLELADGRLLAAWYAGTPQCMSIHWARISL